MATLKNNRHELFAQALLKGMSQTDAAIQAGYSPKWARSHAHKLTTKDYIIKRREELAKLTLSKTTMTVKERGERLSELARENVKQPVSAKEVVLSIAELNKMGGDYAPERHAIIGDIVVEVVYVDRGKNKDTNRVADSSLLPG